MPGTGTDGGAAAALAHGRIITPGTGHQLGTYGLFPPSAAQQRILTPATAQLTARNAEPELLWFGFTELCGGAATGADYRALADRHSTWVIDGVPAPQSVSVEMAAGWIRFGEAVEVLFERGRTLFLIGPRPLDWEGAAAAWRDAPVPGGAEVSAAMARTARRLAVLVRVESAAEEVPEGVSGS
ncbi:MAG TPA: AFG1/ZapE family ATPase [Arthrobacter sp.]|nr:AFG1/ZapE family ATPase [Arthrobacter sp.]